MEWFKKFFEDDGRRIFYMSVTLIMGVSFLFIEGMKDTGTTLLIAVGTLSLNKARSNDKKTETSA